MSLLAHCPTCLSDRLVRKTSERIMTSAPPQYDLECLECGGLFVGAAVEAPGPFVGDGMVELPIPIPEGAESLTLRMTAAAANALLEGGKLQATWRCAQVPVQFGVRAFSGTRAGAVRIVDVKLSCPPNETEAEETKKGPS